MTLHGARGRRYAPTCQDYKKMCTVAAMFTMLYASICVGLLVNDLIDISNYLDTWQTIRHGHFMASREIHNHTQTDHEEEQQFFDATVTKVMYTVFICELVLLIISSIALLKGVHQRKQSLIMTWMLIVLATIVFGGAVIIRDYSKQGDTTEIYAKSILYLLFVVSEMAFFKHAVKAFREAKRSIELRNMRDMAIFDPRRPDNTIFSIADNMDQPDPATLFKLPTYDEVTTEIDDTGQGSARDVRGKPPPYEPPAYQP